VYQSVEQCCSTQFKGGCQPGATGNPATCYTPDSFWPDRTCKSSTKCDILYPRTNVFLTGEECCSKSFADGCRVLPTTCKVPQYVKKTCVDGQPAECKRGGWPGGAQLRCLAGAAYCLPGRRAPATCRRPDVCVRGVLTCAAYLCRPPQAGRSTRRRASAARRSLASPTAKRAATAARCSAHAAGHPDGPGCRAARPATHGGAPLAGLPALLHLSRTWGLPGH
jgi:hypothetical protein